jgi:L-fuconolactonase
MNMIADTHIHSWNFEKAKYQWLDGNTNILNRTYHIDEIEAERKELNINSGVLVQAANNFEDTDWMLEVATHTEWIRGVVGWLPLTDSSATQKLLEGKYLKNKYFKGVRHLIHDEADPKWLLQPEVIESLKILAANNISYDIVGVLPAHIETALKVAELVPDLKMVFDHLNHPRVEGKEIYQEWKSMMKTASGNKSFYVKISGLGTACGVADWNDDDLKPAIEFALESFGTDRCFCGGDWPVALLGGSYTKTWSSYKNIISNLLNADECNGVFYNNAAQFYNL